MTNSLIVGQVLGLSVYAFFVSEGFIWVSALEVDWV